MANFVYPEFARALQNKEVEWDTDNFDALLVKTGSTVGTEKDKTTISGFTTLNEYDGANYVRKDVANAAGAINGDDVECDGDDIVWSALGGVGGGDQAIGMLVFWNKGSDATNMPAVWIDSGFPKNGTGSDFTAQFNAAGVWRLRT